MTRRELLAMAATGAFAGEHLNRAPVSHENLTVKLPEAEPVKLSNGVTLLAIEDNRLPIALVRFQMEDAGAIYSPRSGVAECTAEMLIEGGGGRSGKQIADEAARLGATLSSSAPAAAEAATVEASGLTSHFSEWLDLTAAVMLHPSFPADEFSAVKQRWRVRSRLRLTQPSNSGRRRFAAPHLWISSGGHAFSVRRIARHGHSGDAGPMASRAVYAGQDDRAVHRARADFLFRLPHGKTAGRMEGRRSQSVAATAAPAGFRAAHRADRPAGRGANRAGDRRSADGAPRPRFHRHGGAEWGAGRDDRFAAVPDSARREGILLQPGQRLQRLPLCGILAREGSGTDGRDGGFDRHRSGATPPFVRRADSGRRTGSGEIERGGQSSRCGWSSLRR